MIRYFSPPKPLSPFIARFWHMQTSASVAPILPGTGAELIFYTNLACSHLVISRYQPFTFKHTDGQVLAVRIRHNALHYLIPIPILEIIDKPLNAADIWGKQGSILENLLAEAGTLPHKINLLSTFLLNKLTAKTAYGWLNNALNTLYYQQQNQHNPIDNAIAFSGKSIRQFQTIIKQYTGVSPKYFQRTARFEYILRTLLSHQSKQSSLLDIVLKYGYYDQAHFIKDFKHYTGQTPLQYLSNQSSNESCFKKHYYALNII